LEQISALGCRYFPIIPKEALMRGRTIELGILVLFVLLALSADGQTVSQWKDSFQVEKANLTDTGRNMFFILEPGYCLQFTDNGTTLTVTVLSETKTVDGVTTRVVEEREEKNGRPVEISRNFFAIDRTTLDIYYFGEEVDIYKNGKMVSHEGAWLSGAGGAKFGLMMPGRPKVGDKYYQELAPKIAMDRAEVVADDVEMKTPAGTFQHCLRIKETSAVESGTSEKVYAPGVGLIRDDEFVLTKYGKIL
jgi:hypothetical protein